MTKHFFLLPVLHELITVQFKILWLLIVALLPYSLLSVPTKCKSKWRSGWMRATWSPKWTHLKACVPDCVIKSWRIWFLLSQFLVSFSAATFTHNLCVIFIYPKSFSPCIWQKKKKKQGCCTNTLRQVDNHCGLWQEPGTSGENVLPHTTFAQDVPSLSNLSTFWWEK